MSLSHGGLPGTDGEAPDKLLIISAAPGPGPDICLAPQVRHRACSSASGEASSVRSVESGGSGPGCPAWVQAGV